MDQAETTIVRKLSANQLQELKDLVGKLGFELKPIRPKLSKWARRRIARSYKGISAAEAKGPTLIYIGQLPNFRLPWPSDIAEFYATHAGEV